MGVRSLPRIRMRPLAALCVVASCAAAAASASAAPYLAPGGKVLWGGQGGYTARHIADFARQSGRHPAVYNYFISWRARRSAIHWLGFRLADAKRHRSRAMLSVSTEGTGLKPAGIARGAGDRFLVALVRLVADHGEVVYLRPLSEMNNANNSYAPYDHSGRPRGRAFAPRQHIRAWRRLAIITRGGPVRRINRMLRRRRMPPLRIAASRLPRAPISLMWVPLSFGNPEIPRNHPRHFWPGGRYVDWVGTTWYSPHKESSAMDRFYRGGPWRRKPFAFAEWGVWGRDDPAFVRQFFFFLRSHPRVRMAVYYQSANLEPEFRLSTHPATRAQLRRSVRWPRLTGLAPRLTR